MKRICLFIALSVLSATSFAQIGNPGMEDWRNTFAGFPFPTIPISNPKLWSSADSLALSVGPLIGGSGFTRQVFKETVKVHSGAASAKVMSAYQDTLGLLPGMLTDAKIGVDLASTNVTFTGGTAVTVMPQTVSAWVAYSPGIDSTTDTIGYDEGALVVQAYANVWSVDSMVGSGFVNITPSDTFYQITATLDYTTSDFPVHTLRILFISSGGTGDVLDSSTLYVDDLSMTSTPNPPPPVSVNAVRGGEQVQVFPNPAKGSVYVTVPENGEYTYKVLSISGQTISQTMVKGTGKVDVSGLAAGIYLYTVTGPDKNVVKYGKLNVTQ
ncbi:MAG: T9SS type A sorting domain-containing protein [Flavipsychrobacter sp.]|nr:T9SS type A sorting domain-containing protein [Flavipsychrobacter sp.]